MQALGLIETKGLLAAVESADVMLKAADVSLLERTFVGGGLVSITVTGDVAAVKAAVEAAGAAVKRLGDALLLSQHVIPRPHESLENVILFAAPLCSEMERDAASGTEENKQDMTLIGGAESMEDREAAEEIQEIQAETDSGTIHREDVDRRVLEYGLENTIEFLSKFKVLKLRNLAREYKELGISGRLVSKADKQQLLTEFRAYYDKN